jgi:hypothetical protein
MEVLQTKAKGSRLHPVEMGGRFKADLMFVLAFASYSKFIGMGILMRM